MITDKVGGSSAKPEVSKQSKEKRLQHKVSGYKPQSKRRSIAGCRLLLRTLVLLGVGYNKEALVCTVFTANKPQGSYPFLNKKFKDFSQDFEGHISYFSRTPFNAKKSLESTSFLVLPQHEQFYPEDLSVSGLYKVSTEIQGLSSTDCNFQGLSRTFKEHANPEAKGHS